MTCLRNLCVYVLPIKKFTLSCSPNLHEEPRISSKGVAYTRVFTVQSVIVINVKKNTYVLFLINQEHLLFIY